MGLSELINRLPLPGRFLAALSPLLIIFALSFGITFWQFYSVIKTETVDNAIRKRMDQFILRFEENPEMPLPATGGFQGYAATPPLTTLPPSLQQLNPGAIRTVTYAGNTYYALRRQAGGRDYVLLYDANPLESIRERMLAIIIVHLIASLGLAILLSYRMARQVNRPVADLARWLSTTDISPLQGPGLAEEYRDHDLAMIAHAFDNYRDRLANFIVRERAFTEDASHELRTPLTIILSSLQLLAEDSTICQSSQLRIARIRRAAESLQSLLEALLWLSREDMASELPKAELADIIEESLPSALDMAAQRPLEIRFHNQSGYSRSVARGIAAGVVNNLLLNAVQHTDAGLIEIILDDQTMTLRDTGYGIPEQDLQQIFERRYRGAQSRGQGLGLYIVSRMCAALGWRIRVESVSGQGAAFIIDFNAPDDRRALAET